MVAGGGAWYFTMKKAPTAPPPAVEAPAAVAPAPVAAPSPAEIFPKLEESDAWVRGKAAGLSSDARFEAWLRPNDLLARFAAAVNIVAAGRVPVEGLAFLRPRRKFAPREIDGRFFVDPKSYERYNAAADIFASLDTVAAANFFRTARPLIDAAWANLGEGRTNVLDGVVRASRQLLAAPVLPARTELRPCEKGITFCYSDDSLEQNSLAQKQLMRMGPRNQRKMQAKVRELARVLGASEESLR